uniref:hypothetical protein n=1 Tax=Vibrio ostreicida TaxID=526588 RepID=UPI0015C34651
ENALKASAESVAPAKTFTLDQQAPSLSNADLGVGSASVDEERTVVLTFSEAVTQPTATLGSETVRWTSTGTRQTAWTGEVTVKSADATVLSLPFKVSGFTDNSGNPGVESTEHSVVLTPSIAVGNIEINAGRLTFNGNAGRVGDTATVTLSLLDSQNTQKTVSFEITQSDWSHDMALTTLSELSAGAIRVTAQIENALKASAESVAPAKTFTLDQQAPSLSNADLGVGSASVDEERTVVLTFSEAVTQPTATLGSETVRWTSTGTRQTAWTGEVTVKSADATALSLPFKVSGFTDNSGNPGVESTEHSVNLQPTLSVLDVDDVSENVAVTIVGKSTGFVDENNISVTLTPPTGNSLVKSVTLDDEGNWTTSPLDVSGFELGKVTVTVKGSNANRIPALDKSIDFNIIN